MLIGRSLCRRCCRFHCLSACVLFACDVESGRGSRAPDVRRASSLLSDSLRLLLLHPSSITDYLARLQSHHQSPIQITRPLQVPSTFTLTSHRHVRGNSIVTLLLLALLSTLLTNDPDSQRDRHQDRAASWHRCCLARSYRQDPRDCWRSSLGSNSRKDP